MPVVTTRVEPIDRDIQLMLAQDLSPAAQSAAFASLAKEFIAEGDETNRQILGRIPPRKTWVDGSEGAALERVRPGGVIAAEWELVSDVLLWIAKSLSDSSPVGSGRDPHPGLYKKSHTLFADAIEVPSGGQIPQADEYVFMNLLPYARILEFGRKDLEATGKAIGRAAMHIYQGVADRAASRFGNIAKIKFTMRGIVGGQQINVVGGTFFRGRAKSGRFVNAGGTRTHNVSDVRFPAISIRVG